MKILFYINTLGLGGAERVISNLATKFIESDNNVVMVNSFKAQKEYSINEKIKRFFIENTEYKGNRFIKNIKRILLLRKIIKQEKPDVVISFMAEANFRAVIASLGLTVKTVVSVRNDPNREYKGVLGWIVGKLLLPLADGCVFQTEEARNWFPKKLQDKSTIIFNPVSDNFYNVEYNGVRKNVVATGRLSKQKNHELLIRSFASIASKVEDNLIIYGEGAERAKLEKLISDLGMSERIFLPGSVNNVPDTIKTAKIYVLSSDYEGMPNGLMEAMALGLPCISTDCPCGGPRSIITNNVNGILFKVGNQRQIANELLELLKNEKKCFYISQNAKFYSMNFTLNRIFLQWKEYIEEIIGL